MTESIRLAIGRDFDAELPKPSVTNAVTGEIMEAVVIADDVTQGSVNRAGTRYYALDGANVETAFQFKP